MKKYLKKVFLVMFLSLLGCFFCENIVFVENVLAEDSVLTLELIGNDTIYLEKGVEYKEYGATAYDSIEGVLTDSIEIDDSELNVNQAGIYEITYTVASASSSVSKTRTVIVFEDSVDYSLWTVNGSDSSSSNIMKKIIKTSDGGYAGVGTIYYTYDGNRNFCQYLVKFDADFKLEWNKFTRTGILGPSYYDYGYDIAETENGEIITLGYSSSFSKVYFTVYSMQGEKTNTIRIDGDYKSFDIVSENKYVLFNSAGTKYKIVEYDEENDEWSSHEVDIRKTLDFSFYKDGYIYNFSTDGYAYIIDVNNESRVSKQINVSFSEIDFTSDEEYIYINFYYSNKNYLYKFDSELNVIDYVAINGLKFESFEVSEKYLVLKAKRYLEVYKLDDLSYFITKNISIETSKSLSCEDMLITDGSELVCAGGYFYSSHYLSVAIFDDLMLYEIPDIETNLKERIDYVSGVAIKDINGNSLGSFNVDYSNVNINRAGNYKAYYTFTIITENGIKTYYLDRNVTVHPLTTFEEGGLYLADKTIDVEGATITINDATYNYGDIYNMPGNSTMVLTGENGYTKTINFEIELMLAGVDNEGVYYHAVSPLISGGNVTLNGEEFSFDEDITTKGNHILVIEGANGFSKTITFTIEATILGVEDGMTYYETIQPSINAENMLLNEVIYNNEIIENCGNYTIKISGTNGYEKTISFVIETIVNDLENNGVYEEEVTPTFTKGTATLNDLEYLSGNKINTPGKNVLKIVGENNYLVEYEFTINLGIYNVETGNVYNGEVTPIISGGDIFLNDVSFVSGTKINVPGNYTLKINGASSFVKTLYFIVNPYELNVENGGEYDTSIVPVISNGTLLLNGLEYVSGTELKQSGDYTLDIIGVNGYYNSISFVMVAGVNVEDGNIYNEPITLRFVGDATLNGEVVNVGDVIKDVGNHVLELVDNGNTTTYNFVIEPDYSLLENGFVSSYIIEYDNCNMKLNGDSVEKGYVIDNVGTYSLNIEGVNGYSKTVTFDVKEDSNIIDGSSYIDEINVIVSGGVITLDGDVFEGEKLVDEIGKHILRIEGENGYINEITFYVVPFIENVENGELYYGSVIPLISKGTITLNDVTYTSGVEISQAGIYSIKITGVNGYVQEINFIVLPSDFEIVENSIYSLGTSISYNIGDMKLNGESYVVNSEINSVGINELTFNFNGIEKTIEFYVLPEISGLENNEIYEGSVTPFIDWPYLLLDNNSYTSGTEISLIGNHTLTIVDLSGYDHEIDFTIKEIFEGVIEGAIYNGSVTPSVANGLLYLNDNAYTSGTVIDLVGNHILRIEGSNGYVNTISFTVTEVIENLIDEESYIGSVTPSINNATLYLNEEVYTSGTAIKTVGNNELKIVGVNGYENTISFTVIESVTYLVKEAEYTTYITPTFSGGTLTLDGESYTSGTRISSVGYHTLVVEGVNDYVNTYEFTILPGISGVEDEGVYTSSSVYVRCSNATLKLNGNEYITGTAINQVGNYTVEIYGTNDYYKKITFVKEYTSNVADGDEFTYYANVSVSNATLYLDGESYTSTNNIYEIGNHTIKVVGVGDYEKEFSFTIKASYSGVSNDGKYYSNNGIYLKLKDSNNNNLNENYYERITLNGEEYINNSSYYVVGNHTFVIYGANGYTCEINFTINPYTSFLGDYEITNDSIYPFVEKNGTFVSTNKTHSTTSTFLLKAIDDFVLTLEYMVSSETSYDYFSIYVNSNKLVHISGTSTWVRKTFALYANDVLKIQYSKDYSASQGSDEGCFRIINTLNETTGSVTPTIYLADKTSYFDENTYVLLNNEYYTVTTEINQVGNHSLVIKGIGNYHKEYNFTIHPVIEGVVDDGDYNDTVIPSVANCELLLDGESYISGTNITNVGNHMLTIYGVNGYEKVISFTVHSTDIQDYEDKTFDGNVIVNPINGAKLYLNDEEYNNEIINEIGVHTMKVVGNNGYEQSFSFTVKEKPVLRTSLGEMEFVNDFVTDKAIYLDIKVATEILIDEEPYENNSRYNKVGRHYLIIKGLNGYSSEYTFTIEESINGFENGGMYSSVIINCDGAEKLILNGDEIYNNSTINDVGNYLLVVEGSNGYRSSYEFKILENILNVGNNDVYNAAISPLINSKNIYLDGEEYVSGTTIDSIGNHLLEITGPGGYNKQISFTIVPVVEGVSDGEEYVGRVQPIINSNNITLDGKTFVSGLQIDEVGIHTLVINGTRGYTKTISFAVHPSVSGIDYEGIYQGNVTPIISGGTIKLNGNIINSNETINIIGNHVLEISGVNGYTRTINFTIEPKISNLIESSYLESFKPDIEGVSDIMLNGEEFTKGDVIDTVGNNWLVFNGVGGYNKRIVIVINPRVSGISDGDSVVGECTIQVADNLIATIDNVNYVSGTTYKIIGNHTLRVYGINNYVLEIDFTIKEPINYVVKENYKFGLMNIEYENCEIYINDFIYVSGTNFVVPGHHVYTIKGSNGYTSSYNFTIFATIDGALEDGGVYEHSVEIYTINGLFYIDGVIHTSGSVYSVAGHHTLLFKGHNDYEYEIDFTINPSVVGVIDKEIYKGSVNIVVSNFDKLYIDDVEYLTGSTYSVVGNHILTIEGSNGYKKMVEFVIEPLVSNLVNNSTYVGTAFWNIAGNYEVLLDGKESALLGSTSRVGNHILIIKGSNDYEKIIEFSVAPLVLGVEDGLTYLRNTTISVSDGEVRLDGKLIENDYTVDEIGNHTLTVIGENGYKISYSFVVVPANIGVENNSKYNKIVSLDIPNCIAYLNSEKISGKYVVNEPGDYELEIVGVNDYSTTYNFSISSSYSGIINGNTYYSSVTPTLGVGTWYLNGNVYQKNKSINEPGNYILMVKGPDYELKCEFTIKLDLAQHKQDIIKNNKTQSSVQLYIDGILYKDGSKFVSVGNHVLEYKGANGLSESVDFVINPQLDIADGGVYTDKILVKKIDAKMYLDGVEIFDDIVVDDHGNHTLVIEGTNGYSKEINFEYKNPNYLYVTVIAIISGVICIAAVALILSRKKVI